MDTIDVDAMSPQYRWSKLYAMAKELHMTCDHCGHCVERGFNDYCTSDVTTGQARWVPRVSLQYSASR